MQQGLKDGGRRFKRVGHLELVPGFRYHKDTNGHKVRDDGYIQIVKVKGDWVFGKDYYTRLTHPEPIMYYGPKHEWFVEVQGRL